MSHLYFAKGQFPTEYFAPTANYIRSVQTEDGAIPWFRGGHLDVWDHVEAAMGLSVAGHFEEARAAYRWLAQNQLPDGSWWVEYRNGVPSNLRKRETNFVAYVATGVWHHFLVTDDLSFLREMWPVVRAALDFVVGYQSPKGEIYWAVLDDNDADEDALITGCSSIYKSLECGIEIAGTLGHDAHAWRVAREELGEAIRGRPDRFDRTWESKERFSMDWFYPVLAGVVSGIPARVHLREKWDRFIIEGKGCKCVEEKPWVTIAESCELVMALLAAGVHVEAEDLYAWLHQWRDPKGAYWTGVVFPERLYWPVEQPTWTAGAILLAVDALTGATPAATLFTGRSHLDTAEDAKGLYRRQLFEEA